MLCGPNDEMDLTSGTNIANDEMALAGGMEIASQIDPSHCEDIEEDENC